LASGGDDTTIKLWDITTGELLATLIALNDEDFIITTPELYYLTSKNGTGGVAFRTGNKVYPFEQFDLQFNRPDKVLEKIGYASQSIIDALKRAYDKRLKRLGFNEDQFQPDFHLPVLSLITQDIPATTQDKILRFTVEANDSKYNLDRLQLTVNGVPVYGMRGMAVPRRNSDKYTHEFELELTKGLNRVEISAMNDTGVESRRESFEINYEGATPPVTLHLVTMGVSEYENSEMNLRYAAKDAQDITLTFKNKKQYVNNADLGYDKVISYAMNNSLATLGQKYNPGYKNYKRWIWRG